MDITRALAYKKAFNAYMRHGTPIELSLKTAAQEHPTTHYIWRTRGDNKVRAAHAANNGRIFAWDNPPSTGHPGEDYNCRCTAEPYFRGVSEFAYQTLVSGMQDSPDKWGNIDFTRHFYSGNGIAVTLGETGNFTGVLNFYFYTLGKYNDVNAQIVDAARNHSLGAFSYDFKKSYPDFGNYLFVFGGGTVSGVFTGTVRHENGMMHIHGIIEYRYSDTFTDPRGIRQRLIGTSNPAAATPQMLEDTEYGGTYYDILGEWQTSFRAEAKIDEQASRYQWE